MGYISAMASSSLAKGKQDHLTRNPASSPIKRLFYQVASDLYQSSHIDKVTWFPVAGYPEDGVINKANI